MFLDFSIDIILIIDFIKRSFWYEINEIIKKK